MRASVNILLWFLLTVSTGVVVAQSTYNNPIVEQRADPWVFRHGDGYYYFIGTVPEFNRLVLRRAQTINDLSRAEEKTIWQPNEQSGIEVNIWAPELHYIDNQWVIYFAEAAANKPWAIRMYALTTRDYNPLTTNQKRKRDYV